MSGPSLVIFVVLVQRYKRIESLSQGSLIHNFGVVPEQKPHPFGHIARTGVDPPGRNGVVGTPLRPGVSTPVRAIWPNGCGFCSGTTPKLWIRLPWQRHSIRLSVSYTHLTLPTIY